MELMACIVALRAVKQKERPITVCSDSSYEVNGINKGWARSWRFQRGASAPAAASSTERGTGKANTTLPVPRDPSKGWWSGIVKNDGARPQSSQYNCGVAARLLQRFE